ncbi:MAG TPA: hypothetical protein VFM50_12095 [Nocardioidaceae bacterium]|nr:hypothetical protein [Nocardioidaceae bacterium]
MTVHRSVLKTCVRMVAGLLGTALVVAGPSPASAAPAAPAVRAGSATAASGPLDDLLGGLPVLGDLLAPVAEGAGSVQCLVPSGGGCDGLGLTDLLSLDSLSLLPVPEAGSQFGGWTGCPTPLPSGICEVPTSLLQTLLGGLGGTPLAPIAQFLPLPGAGDPGAPAVTITAAPESETAETTAVLRFSSVTDGATFECELTGPGRSGGFSSCTSPQTYTGLKPSDEQAYVFSVRASSDGVTGQPATRMWTVTDAGAADGRAPQTRITEGPRNHAWLLQDFVAFGYDSDERGVTYQCGLKKLRRCAGHQKVYTSLAGRTHTFRVRAIDAAGNVDRTPARRTFTVPRDNTTLKHSKAWRKRSARHSFGGTYSQTSRRGATLSKKSGHIKRLALVATTGKRYGTVRVYVGKLVVARTVSLHARKRHRSALIPIRTFKRPRHGRIRVVVTSRHRPVRIEGLGIATR